jgi:outer membrane protein TolC
MPALRFYTLTGLAVGLLTVSSSLWASELSLARAEALALDQSARLSHHRTNVMAANERVVYGARLPDPQLTFGVVNVPSDSFSLRDDDATMTVIGVRQQFPPGDTLTLRERRAQIEVAGEESQFEMERRALTKRIRELWLDLYLQEQSARVVEGSRGLQERALTAAQARYRAAQESQQTVLRNRQALARLDERLLMYRAQASARRAELSRWLGDAANDPISSDLPALPVPAELDLAKQPDVRYAETGLEIAKTDVDLARQEYKPGFMVDVQYGARQSAADGTRRPGMVTAMLTLDVPLFAGKRQDRRVAEKRAMEAAAEFQADDTRREVQAMYRATRAENEALAARVKLFEEQLLPDARRESTVTASGFARDTNELREARIRAIDTELELLQVRVELAKSQAALLYYAGEGTP